MEERGDTPPLLQGLILRSSSAFLLGWPAPMGGEQTASPETASTLSRAGAPGR